MTPPQEPQTSHPPCGNLSSAFAQACDAIGRAFDPRDANLQEGSVRNVGQTVLDSSEWVIQRGFFLMLNRLIYGWGNPLHFAKKGGWHLQVQFYRLVKYDIVVLTR